MECLDEIDSFIKNDMTSNHPIHKAIGFQILKVILKELSTKILHLKNFRLRQETTLNDKLRGLKIDR